jgi:coenzyme F420-reducing hydrogenase delta subunit
VTHSEVFVLVAHRVGLVGDVVIGTPTDKCHFART